MQQQQQNESRHIPSTFHKILLQMDYRYRYIYKGKWKTIKFLKDYMKKSLETLGLGTLLHQSMTHERKN